MSQNDDEKQTPVDRELPRDEIVSSKELLKGRRELLIAHQGEVYRLRLTRQDKLIFHK